jgi:PAS domain S-box-containing protein
MPERCENRIQGGQILPDSDHNLEQESLRRRLAELEVRETIWRETEENALPLNAMIQSADDAIIGKTVAGVVQTWNPGAERLYGYSAAEMIGREMVLLLPPDRPDEEAHILERIACGDRVEHFNTVRLRKDGRLVHVSVAISPIMAKDGTVIGASHVARDITQNVELELARARLAAIVESSDDAIISKDLRGVVQTWNKGAQRIYGYSAAEMMGRPMSLLLPADRPDEETSILERIGRGERVDHFETVRLRNDGKQIDVSLSISPIRDKDGAVRGASHVARDITERRHIETEQLHAQKLESLGVLAGGVAHDFNNLLTGILGNASLVADSLHPANPNRRILDECVKSAERAALLTRQLLAYAGKGRFVTESIDLSALVREISTLIQTSIPRKVEVRLDLADDLPAVEGDAGQIQQVIMNLIINGAEAIGENVGLLVCTTAVQTVDDAGPQITDTEGQHIGPGRYVVLDARDSGSGIDAATLPRIFDPFFTTKFTGRGLGLAAVSGIVRGHRGAITVQSSPGKGSRFSVYFPAAGHSDAPHPGRATNQLYEDGSGLVLIVDDEEAVRSTARNTLQRRGYRTIEAKDGREAVEIFGKFAPETALVLLDLTMPFMNGEEVLEKFKGIAPSVPVVLSSGFNQVEAVRRFTGKGLAGFIQKPYTSSALAETVKRLISEKPS